MNRKPHILITNDDGIHAEGIHYLWQALADQADITIVAPSQQQSGVGMALTMRSPLTIKQIAWDRETPAYSVNGTPSDCVKMALTVLLKKAPDLIVSGVNHGSNVGRNILYSGTVAGVIEGALRGLQGIAFSCQAHDIPPEYTLIERYVPSIIDYILNHPLRQGTFLNVNFPNLKIHDIQGCKLCRQGMEYWMEDPVERKHPTGNHSYFWIGAQRAKFPEHQESDSTLLDQGYVSAAPIHVHDHTD